jgi:serine/threonine-protein kinase
MERPMSIDRHSLLTAILEQPREYRTAFLDRACGSDTALRQELERLLREHDDSDPFLLPGGAFGGPLGDDLRMTFEREDETLEGSRIGPYRIVRELGRGGMAVVYLAARADGGFDQEVALKLMKRGIDTDEVLTRFRQERQILASLNHSSIARLLDGGVAADGRPFFAMELVRGEPIDRFGDAHHLSLDERVDLCIEVGRAVQYAHRALVVHRDLKPSNILITADRQIKLLDFGIAKLLDASVVPSLAPPTRTSMRLMTPEYASPEQVRGEPITTAADVYQLGLLVFELSTGQKAHALAGLGPAEAERVICERDPPRPSLVARRAGDIRSRSLLGIGRWRRPREVGPELDDIVLTALRKEPERRYASVQQLVDDLERYRQGLPISVRGRSWRYRTGKFLRRHAAAVSVGATVATMLTGIVAFYSLRLATERDAAQREAATASSVAAFTVGLFEVSNPFITRQGDVTARELLDRGAARIDAELGGQAEVQARLMQMIGEAYRRMALYAQSASLLQRTVDIQRTHLGPRSPEIAHTLRIYGLALDGLGRFDEAGSALEEALSIREERARGDDLEVAIALNALGFHHRLVGTYDRARDELERSMAIQERLPTRDDRVLAVSLNNLGVVYQRMGHYAGARQAQERALAIEERLSGADHPAVASMASQLAETYRLEEDYAAARLLLERAISINEKTYGASSYAVAANIAVLASLISDSGDYAAARPVYERAIAMFESTVGPDHPDGAFSIRNLGNLHRATGAYSDALKLYERALDIRVRAFGRVHPDVARSLESVGAAHLLLGNVDAAEPVLREALDVARQTLPSDHMTIGDASTGLGWCLVESRRFEEAEPLLVDGYRILLDKRGASHVYTKAALERLITLYERWGKMEQASHYRAVQLRP